MLPLLNSSPECKTASANLALMILRNILKTVIINKPDFHVVLRFKAKFSFTHTLINILAEKEFAFD